MKHVMYTFRLHRLGVILIGVGLLVLAVGLFVAGWMLSGRLATSLALSASQPTIPAVDAASVPGVSFTGPRVAEPSVAGGLGTAPTLRGPTVTKPTARVDGRAAALGVVRRGRAEDGGGAQAAIEGAELPSESQLDPMSASAQGLGPPVDASSREEEAELPEEPSSYTLQVGTFLDEEEAKAQVTELGERGYEPYVVKRRTSLDRLVYLVRLGSFPTLVEADREARLIRKDEELPAVAVREGRSRVRQRAAEAD